MTYGSTIKISVIIPFYQKKHGILFESLRSVFLQSKREFIYEIIVVDDGSPRPARPEIELVASEFNNVISINLVEQNNGGVSSARNTGLRSVSKNASHIAFLDSDDRWMSNHIEYAVRAINLGAKFFFSNFYQINCTVSTFDKSSNFDFKKYKEVEHNIYFYDQCFVNQIVVSNPIGTPTVVYERFGVENVVFDTRFKYAGEDYMMWITLSKHLGNVYFCTEPTVVCDSGVNIFSGAKWGTLHLSNRIVDEISYRKCMLLLPELTHENKEFVLRKIKYLKIALLKNTLSRIKKLEFKGFLKFTYLSVAPF